MEIITTESSIQCKMKNAEGQKTGDKERGPERNRNSFAFLCN